MNEQNTLNILEAVSLLRQGCRLRLSSMPVLFRYDLEREKILISGSGYMLKCSMDDFCELYGDMEFFLIEEREGIDEQKDEEYYQWRSVHQ